jgi:hypothetical protein
MPIVEISNGELADKWTILNIKCEQLNNTDQISNAKLESEALMLQVQELQRHEGVVELIEDLYKVNLKIWYLMENLYRLNPPFDEKYVKLTVDITKQNQRRAFLKKDIDRASKAQFTEAKSFFEDDSYIMDNK